MAAQTQPILVLMLSPKRVTAAEVQLTDGELLVSALAELSPPEGAFSGAQLTDGEALGRAVAQFMADHQVASRRIVMVLPEGSAVTQLIKLPSMPREDMVGAVRAVAERYALFAEHQISVDCAVVERVEEDGAEMANVLVAAARLSSVEQCQDCARAAGLELVSIETIPVAAARAYRERLRASDVVALAVVGEVKTDVMIFDNGILRLCYSANAGLPEETAQGEWISRTPGQHDPFAPPPQLYSELAHCFHFFQNQFPGRGVHRVVIAADHPRAEVIASHLSEQLQLPVELGRPDQALRLPAAVNGRALGAEKALSLALLHGSALLARGEEEPSLALNLLPQITSAWRLTGPFLKLAAAAVGVILLASLLWGWSLRNKIGIQERKLTSVQAQIAKLEPELEAIRAAKAAELALFSEVERQTARLAKERAVRWSQILEDIAGRLPADMWLTRLASPDSSRIALVGIATNRETIPNAIEALSDSPYLENVVLGSLSKDDSYRPGGIVIRYQINANLLRGLLPPSLAESAPAPTDAAQTPPQTSPESARLH